MYRNDYNVKTSEETIAISCVTVETILKKKKKKYNNTNMTENKHRSGRPNMLILQKM